MAPSGLIHPIDTSENGYNQCIKKLSEYEDLKQQNKLIILPCAVGDVVYILKQKEILRNYVVQIHISQTVIQTIFSCYGDSFTIEQLGKTVFTTKKQAESALEEMNKTESDSAIR